MGPSPVSYLYGQCTWSPTPGQPPEPTFIFVTDLDTGTRTIYTNGSYTSLSMKKVRIAPDLYFVALQDEEGPFGLLLRDGDEETNIVEVESREEFVSFYNQLVNR